MRRTISLDGTWQRRDFLDEAWRWSDALRGDADEASTEGPPIQAGLSSGWRRGSVPGCTIDDAWRGGEIPNPYVDRNSLAAEWVPQRTWLYRRHVVIPAGDTERAAIRFDGIDPGGRVFWDGAEVAQHRGSFVPLEVDLGEAGTPGEHELVVVVDPASPMPSQVSRTELAREHRSRMGYGWDFCPRFVHTGIWQSVALELRHGAWLRPPRVRVRSSDAHEPASADVDVTVGGSPDGLRVTVEAIDGTTREVIATVNGAPDERGVVSTSLDVSVAARWWPNGMGAAARHRIVVRLHRAETVLDERAVTFGVRHVEWRRNVDAPAGALPYTVVVNGRPTWIRGWNWVPVDAAYGVPRPGRLRHLVELARRANVNLLRVWGGGLIETEAFYDACDAAGIMVWQEFVQSSSGVANTPSGDGAFVTLLRDEAAAIVPTRTHHPSLVLWCGGNELTDRDGRALTDAHPALAALHEVVRREDPDRAWLPTSPTGPRFDNTLRAIEEDPQGLHDVHGPWEHQGLRDQHRLADATTSLLHSEFGVEGITNLPALVATVSQSERHAMDRSNPTMAHRGAWWNNEPFVQASFGGGLTVEELERASQHLQADGLRTLIEGDRRRWPRNAGSLPWQLNEPFPNAWSTAAVDYFGVPKAAYHAVADAYASTIVGLGFDDQALHGADRFEVRPWAANGAGAGMTGSVLIELHDVSGRPLDRSDRAISIEPDSVADMPPVVLDVPADAAELLVLDASLNVNGAAVAFTRRLLSRTDDLAPIRRLAPARLAATVEVVDGDRWVVRLAATGGVAAVEVRLADARPVGWPERRGAMYTDANVLTLLPAEERSVVVDWVGVPAGDRRVRVDGWNVRRRVLRGG